MPHNETGVNATNRMLCCNPGTPDVAAIPWPDKARLSEQYQMSTLACNSEVQEMSFGQRKMVIFIEAMHLIIRDKCNPNAVHNALLNLDEYRDGCADDMLSIT